MTKGKNQAEALRRHVAAAEAKNDELLMRLQKAESDLALEKALHAASVATIRRDIAALAHAEAARRTAECVDNAVHDALRASKEQALHEVAGLVLDQFLEFWDQGRLAATDVTAWADLCAVVNRPDKVSSLSKKIGVTSRKSRRRSPKKARSNASLYAQIHGEKL